MENYKPKGNVYNYMAFTPKCQTRVIPKLIQKLYLKNSCLLFQCKCHKTEKADTAVLNGYVY